MEAYVDDILVKRMTSEHLKDLKKVFYVLGSCKMKFNLAKCVFASDEENF